MQLNVLIVEDSIAYAIELEQLAMQIGYNVIGNVDNSAEALDIIFSKLPDIILMDINIKGRLSGIEISKRIHHLNIPVLYITSFDDPQTYNAALESNLVGYLVKPVNKLTLTTSLKLLIERNTSLTSTVDKTRVVKKEDDNYVFFMKKDVYQKVDIRSIAFIKSDDNYCRFILDNDNSYLLRIKLNEVEEMLKDYKFIRCHRQFIVNHTKIKKVNTSSNSLELGNHTIPFSRSKKHKIMSIGVFLR